MGLSRLAAKCRTCPYVSTCDHKQMEALGYLPLPEPTIEIQTINAGYNKVDPEKIFDEMARLFHLPKSVLKGDTYDS